MKKISFFLTAILLILVSKFGVAQSTLYSTTRGGGTGNAGTIIEFDISNSSVSKYYDFPAGIKAGGLVHIDNDFFGLTENAIFKVNANNPVVTTPVVGFSLPPNDIFHTNGQPTVGFDRGLYFGQPEHSQQHNGTIMRYSPDDFSFNVVLGFGGTNGSIPETEIIMDGQTIYGVTFAGGNNYLGNDIYSGDGVLYKIELNSNGTSNSYTVLHYFDDSGNQDGKNPYGKLLLGKDGNLYGTTTQGGANLAGTLYKYDLGSNTFHKLHDFDFSDGSTPGGGLMEYSSGVIYGTTPYGGDNLVGVVFRYITKTANFSILHHFDFFDTGENPNPRLYQSNNGKTLYGHTNQGGNNGGLGAIFKINCVNGQVSWVTSLSIGSGYDPQNTSFVELCSGGPNISLVSLQHERCQNSDDGRIEVSVSGGTGPLTYSWFNSSNNKIGSELLICDLSDGVYDFVVVDSRGCSARQSYTINQGTGECQTLHCANETERKSIFPDNFEAENSNLKVFPQPAKSILNLEYENRIPVSMRIINYTGKQFYERHQIKSKKVEISLTDFPSGYYQILSTYKNGNVEVVDLIVK